MREILTHAMTSRERLLGRRVHVGRTGIERQITIQRLADRFNNHRSVVIISG